MDIHKPKAWHSFREFLKEYLIVVVGVLTALAAEQGAEWLHWRHQVQETDERLIAEVRENLSNAYLRVMVQRCYDDRLAKLRDQLRRSGAWSGAAIQRTPVPAPETVPPYIRAGILTSAVPPVYLTAVNTWPDSSWTSALANGVTLHMGQDRADAYTRLYKSFAAMSALQSTETEAASKLSALALDRDLSEAERAHFLESIGQLSLLNVELSSGSRGVIDAANASGVRLKQSEVAHMLGYWRHYFLVRDCVAPVSVPVAPG